MQKKIGKIDWRLIKIRKLITNRRYLISVLICSLVYSLSIQLLKICGNFADSFVVMPQKDFFHSIIPLMDLSLICDLGFRIFLFMMLFYMIFIKPEDIPFILLTSGFFVFARAILFSITILGVPTERFNLHPFTEDFLGFKKLYFNQDLFPSGHTGKPFVMFLMTKGKFWKTFFLVSAIMLGAGVLITRVHYSLDVFGALFVGYSMYRISYLLFKKYLTFDELTI